MTLENVAVGKPLRPRDIKTLAARWISPALAAAANLTYVNSVEGAEQVGRTNNADYSGILIPYVWPGENRATAYRLRRERPDIEITGGKKREKEKYLTARGTPNKLYFPPTVTPEQLADAKTPLVVTEGEFKALALARAGAELEREWAPAAISGVENWRGRIGRTTDQDGARIDERGPLPDWERLTLEHRTVFIVYDADLARNPAVRIARYRLAEFLIERKARPRYVNLPPDGPNGPKGVDDYLAKHGPAALAALFDQSKPADAAAEAAAVIEAAAAAREPAQVFDSVALFASLTPNQLAMAKDQIRRQLRTLSLRDFENSLRAERARIAEERRTEHERKKEDLRYHGQEYEITEDGTVWWRATKDNHRTPTYIANFSAVVLADIERDNGEEITRALEIRCRLKDETRDIIVSAAEFEAMSWPIVQLGAAANIQPLMRDRTRAAIQTLSEKLECRRLYEHTGWSMLNGHAVYLHAAGAIGAHGHIDQVRVDLERPLDRYELPPPPEGPDLIRAIRSSLEMLEVSEDRITLPLYSAVWRAALGPVHTSLWISGQTGQGKSELAALAQQHYGAAFHAKALPSGWDSTANALEMLSFKAKDAIFCIDDFVPRGTSVDVQRLHLTADRILRAQGNASGRGRLNADTKMRATRNPRGLIIGTGEDVPRGHSLRGRMVILELPAPLEWSATGRAQKAAAAGQYAAAMAAYLRYVAPHLTQIRSAIQTEKDASRAAMAGQAGAGAHQRTPDNIAELSAGLRTFLDFALESKAISDEEAADLWDRAQRAFGSIVDEQAREQSDDEPATQFCKLVLAAVRSGQAHVSSTEKTPPEQPQLWGYPNGEFPAGPWIGWKEADAVFLERQNAFAVAQDLGRRTGAPIQITLATLSKRLKQRGLLVAVDEARQTNYVRKRFMGTDLEVFYFSLSTLCGYEKTRQFRQRHFEDDPEPTVVRFSESVVRLEKIAPDNSDNIRINGLAHQHPAQVVELSELSEKNIHPRDPQQKRPVLLSGCPTKPDNGNPTTEPKTAGEVAI